VDQFGKLFSEPVIFADEHFAKIGQELLLPLKELIDYNGFAQRVLKTYALKDHWNPYKIQGYEKWRAIH
jgi:hypothetical protein